MWRTMKSKLIGVLVAIAGTAMAVGGGCTTDYSSYYGGSDGNWSYISDYGYGSSNGNYSDAIGTYLSDYVVY